MIAQPTNDTGQVPLVLIIDDDQTIVGAISNFLCATGYRTLTAFDGEEGLKAARKYKPDVIVLDIVMPKMDGWALIQQLRMSQTFDFTPLLIMSGQCDSDERVKAFKLGADDYLQKVFVLEELCHRIKKVLLAMRLKRRNSLLETRQDSEKDSSLCGRLEDFSLASLVSLCHIEKTCGILILTNDHGETGMLYFNEGQLISAKAIGQSKLKNEPAISYLITWRKGTFELTNMETSNVPKEIQTTTETILLKAAACSDETNVVLA